MTFFNKKTHIKSTFSSSKSQSPCNWSINEFNCIQLIWWGLFYRSVSDRVSFWKVSRMCGCSPGCCSVPCSTPLWWRTITPTLRSQLRVRTLLIHSQLKLYTRATFHSYCTSLQLTGDFPMRIVSYLIIFYLIDS